MNVNVALEHCLQHGKTAQQFERHFHQWFDGFHTLKFIHALREAGWQQQSLHQLDMLQPYLWPARVDTTGAHYEPLLRSVRRYWRWH